MADNKNKEKEQETPKATEATTEEATATTDPTEEAKQEAQAILDAAKAEAAKIVEEAKAQAEEEATKTTKTTKTTKATATTAPNMVPVRLFKDNDKYKDDVFVAVNGKSYQIKRGEEVMVPDFVAEVLERSAAQDRATANLIDRESGEFKAEAARRGL